MKTKLDTPKDVQTGSSESVCSALLAALREIGEVLKDVPQIGEMDEEIDESDEGYFKLQDGWIDGNTEKWRPMTDDEVKSLYPVTWTRRKIAEILSANVLRPCAAATTPEPNHTRCSPSDVPTC